MTNVPIVPDQSTDPSAGQARDLLERSESAKRAVRAEAHWAATYLAGFGIAALVLIPLGAFLDRWPVVVAVNAAWMVLLVALPVWASRRQVTLRGAGAQIGIAFALFGLLYTVTGVLGVTRFSGDLWWWMTGGVASAAPLLLAAGRQARR